MFILGVACPQSIKVLLKTSTLLCTKISELFIKSFMISSFLLTGQCDICCDW